MASHRLQTLLIACSGLIAHSASGPAAVVFETQQIASTSTSQHFRNQIPADVNSDGRIDVVAHLATGALVWFENAESGWTQRSIATGLSGTQQLGAGDLDGDGALDVFSGSAGSSLRWHRNGGGPEPTFTSSVLVADFARQFLLADLDGDGILDVAMDGGTVPFQWLQSGGGSNPTFTVHTVATGEVSEIIAVDIDGDEDMDLVGILGNRVVWFDNDGDPSPAFTQRLVSSAEASRLTAGDVEGDGDLDLVSSSANSIVWHENDGAVLPGWKTRTAVSFSNGLATDSIAATDLDLDGDLDIFTDNFRYENTGDSPPGWVYAGRLHQAGGCFGSGCFGWDPGYLRLADFDGDGFPDVLTSYSYFTQNCDPFPLPPNCRSTYSSVLRVLFNSSGIFLDEAVQFLDASGDGINDPGEPGVVRVRFRNRTVFTLSAFDAAATSISGEFSFGGPVTLGAPVSPDGVGAVEFPYTTSANANCASPLLASFEIVSIELPLLALEGPVSSEHIGGTKPIVVSAMDAPGLTIPDNDPAGLERALTLNTEGQSLKGLTLILDISHTFRGDLEVELVHPGGSEAIVIQATGMEGIDIEDSFPVSEFLGLIGDGNYTLRIIDSASGDIGTVNGWGLVADYEVYQCTPWDPSSVLDLLLGLVPMSSTFDVNGDGKVDAADLVMMVNGTN